MASNPSDVSQQIAAAPEPIQEMHNRARARAEQLANLPFQNYGRTRTANLSPLDVAAAEMARQQAGVHTPYLQEAHRISDRAQSFPQAQAAYMNPFVENVVQKMREQGNENLTRNIIPALDAKFSRLGQFGSTRHQKQLGQMARDIQNDMATQEYKARMMGYQNAAENFHRDKTADAERANLMGRLAIAAQAGKEGDIKALAERGNYQTQYDQMLKNVEYQDWLRQQAHPHDVLSKWIAAISGIPYPTTNTNMNIGAQIPTMNSAGSYGQIGASLLPLLFNQTPVAQPQAQQQPQSFSQGYQYGQN